ncbi:hypothetical protein Bhyg_12252, partial [Pseudolycoriella hygida]
PERNQQTDLTSFGCGVNGNSSDTVSSISLNLDTTCFITPEQHQIDFESLTTKYPVGSVLIFQNFNDVECYPVNPEDRQTDLIPFGSSVATVDPLIVVEEVSTLFEQHSQALDNSSIPSLSKPSPDNSTIVLNPDSTTLINEKENVCGDNKKLELHSSSSSKGVENMEIESTNESAENMETESTNEGAENMEIDNTNDLLNENSLNEGVKSFSELNLTRIENSNNFHDQNNYLYTKMVTKTLSNSYFRCKNYIRHGCPARAVAKYHDLECALLRKQHNHASNIKDVENEKFSKVMDRVFEENNEKDTKAAKNNGRFHEKY